MGTDVLPCYVVCDVSWAMAEHLGELNAGLQKFRGEVYADAAAAEGVLCCVVGFAETPHVVQQLYPMDELTELPAPGSGAGAEFGPAFTFLRGAIDQDVRILKAHRLRVHRPMVFFLSGGRPADPVTWPAAFAQLTDPGWAARPRVIAVGVGDAGQDALERIGTSGTFPGRDGGRVSTALVASVRRALPEPGRV